MFYQLEADEIQALCGDWLSIEFILGIKAEMCVRNQFIFEVRVPSVQEN